MSTQQQPVRDRLASLRDAYRATGAPPFLASRIRAGLDAQHRRHSRRRPVFAAIAIALCVLALLPFLPRQQVMESPSPLASLSMGLASVRLPPSPSLTRMRSVATPSPPSRPVLPQPDRPVEAPDVQTHYPKEKTHELT